MALTLARFAIAKAEELSRLDGELQALASQAFVHVRGLPASRVTAYSAIPESIRDAVRAALGAGLFPDLPLDSVDPRRQDEAGLFDAPLLGHSNGCATDELPLHLRRKRARRHEPSAPPVKKPTHPETFDVAQELPLSEMPIDSLLRLISGLDPDIACKGGSRSGSLCVPGPAQTTVTHPAAASAIPGYEQVGSKRGGRGDSSEARNSSHQFIAGPQVAADGAHVPVTRFRDGLAPPSTADASVDQHECAAGAALNRQQHAVQPALTPDAREPQTRPLQQKQQHGGQEIGDGHVPPRSIVGCSHPDAGKQGDQPQLKGMNPDEHHGVQARKRAPLWLYQMLPNRSRPKAAQWEAPPPERHAGGKWSRRKGTTASVMKSAREDAIQSVADGTSAQPPLARNTAPLTQEKPAQQSECGVSAPAVATMQADQLQDATLPAQAPSAADLAGHCAVLRAGVILEGPEQAPEQLLEVGRSIDITPQREVGDAEAGSSQAGRQGDAMAGPGNRRMDSPSADANGSGSGLRPGAAAEDGAPVSGATCPILGTMAGPGTTSAELLQSDKHPRNGDKRTTHQATQQEQHCGTNQQQQGTGEQAPAATPSPEAGTGKCISKQAAKGRRSSGGSGSPGAAAGSPSSVQGSAQHVAETDAAPKHKRRRTKSSQERQEAPPGGTGAAAPDAAAGASGGAGAGAGRRGKGATAKPRDVQVQATGTPPPVESLGAPQGNTERLQPAGTAGPAADQQILPSAPAAGFRGPDTQRKCGPAHGLGGAAAGASQGELAAEAPGASSRRPSPGAAVAPVRSAGVEAAVALPGEPSGGNAALAAAAARHDGGSAPYRGAAPEMGEADGASGSGTSSHAEGKACVGGAKAPPPPAERVSAAEGPLGAWAAPVGLSVKRLCPTGDGGEEKDDADGDPRFDEYRIDVPLAKRKALRRRVYACPSSGTVPYSEAAAMAPAAEAATAVERAGVAAPAAEEAQTGSAAPAPVALKSYTAASSLEKAAPDQVECTANETETHITGPAEPSSGVAAAASAPAALHADSGAATCVAKPDCEGGPLNADLAPAEVAGAGAAAIVGAEAPGAPQSAALTGQQCAHPPPGPNSHPQVGGRPGLARARAAAGAPPPATHGSAPAGAAPSEPAPKPERRYKPVAPARRPHQKLATDMPSTHAELAAVVAAWMSGQGAAGSGGGASASSGGGGHPEDAAPTAAAADGGAGGGGPAHGVTSTGGGGCSANADGVDANMAAPSAVAAETAAAAWETAVAAGQDGAAAAGAAKAPSQPPPPEAAPQAARQPSRGSMDMMSSIGKAETAAAEAAEVHKAAPPPSCGSLPTGARTPDREAGRAAAGAEVPAAAPRRASPAAAAAAGTEVAAASDPLEPAGGSDFGEYAPPRPNPAADTATSPVRPSGPDARAQECDVGVGVGPAAAPVAAEAEAEAGENVELDGTRGQDGRAGMEGLAADADGELSRRNSSGCGIGAEGAADDGEGEGSGNEGAAGTRGGGRGCSDQSPAACGTTQGECDGGGCEDDAAPGQELGEEDPAMSPVEREEWRRRRAEIERQRAEAAAKREAARRARIAAEAAAGATAELERRIKQRLADHHQLASAAAAQAAAKEDIRAQVRNSLQETFRKAIDEQSLTKLLRQLDVIPKGASLRNLEARNKALKAAKIRFHPDKVTGSLEERVYAEEVSKLLNSGTWTK